MQKGKGSDGYKVRTIICDGCGETATRKLRPNQRFCSRDCYRAAPRPNRRTGVYRCCEQCDTRFYVTRSRIPLDARFCSRACQNQWQGRNKTEHTCKVCGGAFRWSPSRTASGNYNITYCSQACRDADPDMLAKWIASSALLQDRRTTRAERAGYAILDALGVPYQRQVPLNSKFTPDALIPGARIMVQFDGDYWHDRAGTSTEPRIRRRVALDRSQDAYARACGWEVVRLWETDLRDDPAGCAEQIKRHLRPPS